MEEIRREGERRCWEEKEKMRGESKRKRGKWERGFEREREENENVREGLGEKERKMKKMWERRWEKKWRRRKCERVTKKEREDERDVKKWGFKGIKCEGTKREERKK